MKNNVRIYLIYNINLIIIVISNKMFIIIMFVYRIYLFYHSETILLENVNIRGFMNSIYGKKNLYSKI